MREIKFRAWHKAGKKMFTPEEMGIDQLTLMPDGQGFINVSGASTKLSQLITNMIPMQYTGLKDKNGREVFEGDIIEFNDKRFGACNYEVIYFEYRFTCPNFFKGYMDIPNEPFSEGTSNIEIIGNIYENPELIAQ